MAAGMHESSQQIALLGCQTPRPAGRCMTPAEAAACMVSTLPQASGARKANSGCPRSSAGRSAAKHACGKRERRGNMARLGVARRAGGSIAQSGAARTSSTLALLKPASCQQRAAVRLASCHLQRPTITCTADRASTTDNRPTDLPNGVKQDQRAHDRLRGRGRRRRRRQAAVGQAGGGGQRGAAQRAVPNHGCRRVGWA